MIQTMYGALNGGEIRKITKEQLIKLVDDLKYLKVGNTFHRAEVKFGFVMTAYPDDVPVPEKEVEFHLIDKTLEKEWTNHLSNLNKLKDYHKQLSERKKEIEQSLLDLDDALNKLVLESESFGEISSGTSPDQTRLENNLPIQVLDGAAGKVVEKTLTASDLIKRN